MELEEVGHLACIYGKKVQRGLFGVERTRWTLRNQVAEYVLTKYRIKEVYK